jgi:ketosteroid isomerase-like protein
VAAAAAAKPAPKKAAAPAAPRKESPVEALAKKIVKATTGEHAGIDLADLYADDCVSYEARGEPAIGLAGLEEKNKRWGQMQKRSIWTPLNVATKGSTILIEWSGEVELRDGRTITMREVAVHTVKNGKIAEERYYYDPGIFEQPAAQADAVQPEAAPRPRRAAPPPPVENTGTPSVDPIDL